MCISGKQYLKAFVKVVDFLSVRNEGSLISFSMSVHLSAFNNSRTAERISMKLRSGKFPILCRHIALLVNIGQRKLALYIEIYLLADMRASRAAFPKYPPDRKTFQIKVAGNISRTIYLFIYGSTALCWSLAAFLVGLLGRGISPSQDRYLHTGQHKHTEIHASSGIRTYDPSV
jgi:hypothetical protein